MASLLQRKNTIMRKLEVIYDVSDSKYSFHYQNNIDTYLSHFFINANYLTAGILFCISAITDFFDGYIARNMMQLLTWAGFWILLQTN